MIHGEKKKITRQSVVLLVSLTVLFCSVIGGTAAYLVARSASLTNTFTPSYVTTAVTDDYKIQNTGNTAAWIRAAVVVTWQDTNGNVYGQMPVAGTDYTDWTPGINWVKGTDGFYYYTEPVLAKGETPHALIESINPIGSSPATDYYLTVEILGSGIQTFQDISDCQQAWAKAGATP